MLTYADVCQTWKQRLCLHLLCETYNISHMLLSCISFVCRDFKYVLKQNAALLDTRAEPKSLQLTSPINMYVDANVKQMANAVEAWNTPAKGKSGSNKKGMQIPCFSRRQQ